MSRRVVGVLVLVAVGVAAVYTFGAQDAFAMALRAAVRYAVFHALRGVLS